MKRKIVSLLLSLIMVFTLITPINVMAEDIEDIEVSSVTGSASQLVDVQIKAKGDLDINTIKIKVDYGTGLELVSATNGTSFQENLSLGVCEQDRGSYTILLATSDPAQNAHLSAGNVIFTLKFKLPKEAGTYTVSIDTAKSQFAIADGTESGFAAKNGTITVTEATACAGHTFGQDVVVNPTATYLMGAYSYKTCTACGYVESAMTDPLATNIIKPIGTVIRYAGNPSGIGAHFAVDEEAIKVVEEKGLKISIGIELAYGTRTEKYHFYGDDVSPANKRNFDDGVISAAIEGVNTQLKGTICALVEIINPETGYGRIERIYMTLGDSQKISIRDIADLLNPNKYSQATVDYLTAVKSGGTFEDRTASN